ncbi:unnamed protein product [Chilo suppressalis]|uniref:Endonuclease/exonuclease/phosphatase domain-containing protein n=1 Tax=Chilo suppressalis TaxID=168631 RepID=A0ABN8AZ84_CHISP|nr:unnamed protein product [Chilo suppressalis]
MHPPARAAARRLQVEMRPGCALLLAACCLCAATLNENDLNHESETDDNPLGKPTPVYVKPNNKNANDKPIIYIAAKNQLKKNNYSIINPKRETYANSIATDNKKPINSFRISNNGNNDFGSTPSNYDADADRSIGITVIHITSNYHLTTNNKGNLTNHASNDEHIINVNGNVTNNPFEYQLTIDEDGNVTKTYNNSAEEEDDPGYKNNNNTIKVIVASGATELNIKNPIFIKDSIKIKEIEPLLKYNNFFMNSTIEDEEDLKNITEKKNMEDDELSTVNDFYLSSHKTTTNEYYTYDENDIADQLAFQQYKAETNFVPQTESDKYAQTLASYRFMTLAKGTEWTDIDDETNHNTVYPSPITSTNSKGVNNFEKTELPNNEEDSNNLIDTQRDKLLEFVALDTYRTFETEKPISTPPTSIAASSDFKSVTEEEAVPQPTMSYPKLEHSYRVYSGSNFNIGAFDKTTIPLMQKLRFEFPYFGHNVTNITISTGGYIMTGVAGLDWSADGQGLQPFMTNFDTTNVDDYALIFYDEPDRLTVIWENIPLYGDVQSRFTFSATMYDDGDVTFSYKELPISALELQEKSYDMKIGLVDSFLMNKDAYYVRHKTSHTYTRLSFEEVGVVSSSVLELQVQPACPQHTTCQSCVEHSIKYSNFKTLDLRVPLRIPHRRRRDNSTLRALSRAADDAQAQFPNAELVLLGDFNAHLGLWLGSSKTDDAVISAHAFALVHNLTQLVDQPPRIPDIASQAPSLLNLLLRTHPQEYRVMVRAPLGPTDHCLISAKVPQVKTPRPLVVKRRIWHYSILR